jgi:hypothetical protein
MAASTRALTPTQAGPFGSTLEPNPTKSLAPLSGTLHRSPSPRSPKAVSPRISPGAQLTHADEAADPKHLSAEETARLAKEATSRLSRPMEELAKSLTASENTSQTQGPAVSLSGFDSTSTTTATAPATAQALSHDLDSASGRPVVDPGLPGASDSTPSRAFTYPPPLPDDHQTPLRNLSVPNNSFPGSGSSRGSSSKRHKCPFCSTEFTRHHNLKSHLLTHSQEKPYECMQCQQKFRRLHDLKRHTKLHTGERPHECNVCGRKFARGDALARHNKGPGGCAGRRPSFIEEDPSGSRLDDSMDDVHYTEEPEAMDEDLNGSHGASHDSAKKSGRQDTFRPNTYPGVGQGPMPPMQFTPTTTRSRDPSISSQGPLSSIQHFNAQTGLFQGSLTDSPKPLSPGQSGDRGSGRLPSQFSGASAGGRGTSPMTLPTPATTNSSAAPSLPGLQGFASHAQAGSGSSQQGSGSLSSHNSASGTTTQFDAWTVVRDVETRLRSESEARLVQIQTEHRAEIAALRGEIDRLRTQLNDLTRR